VNDQYILAVFIAGTIVFTVFAVMMTVFLVIHKQRQNRSKLERQQLEFAYNSALLKTKIEMQEQALQFVSQEIHDNVGQVLSFSCIQLSNLKSTIPEGGAKAILSENLDIIRQSVKELRLLSHSLNTTLIEKRDLEEAIEAELSRIRAFSPIKCRLHIEGNASDLSAETRLLIFRIIQEALHNVVKHAAATTVTISMFYEHGGLELCIHDDGKGIDMAKLANTSSVGMVNMRQRAALLNGNLEINSDGRHGTSVTLKIKI
jgi:signal transduction histidine kinase